MICQHQFKCIVLMVGECHSWVSFKLLHVRQVSKSFLNKIQKSCVRTRLILGTTKNTKNILCIKHFLRIKFENDIQISIPKYARLLFESSFIVNIYRYIKWMKELYNAFNLNFIMHWCLVTAPSNKSSAEQKWKRLNVTLSR